jgi:hypothetical protein
MDSASLMGQCGAEGKDSKRDYANDQLRENMGQSESKKREFKEQKRRQKSKIIRKNFRSKVLKNCKRIRP